MKRHLLPLLIFATTLVACSDNDVNSTVDTKAWTFSANMDSTVNPGDNFFMYCNGKWYNSVDAETVVYAGTVIDVNNYNRVLLSKVSDASLNTYYADTSTFNKAETIAKTTELLKTEIHKYDTITTQKAAWDALAETTKEGLYTFFEPDIYPRGGNNTFSYAKASSIYEYSYVVSPLCLEMLGYTNEEIQDITDDVDMVKTICNGESSAKDAENYRKELRNDPEKAKLLFPLKELKTRGSGYSMLDEMTSVLGINPDYVYVYPEMLTYYSEIQALTPAQIKSVIQSRIAQELIYVSQAALDDYAQSSGAASSFTKYYIRSEFGKKYLDYIKVHAFATTYVTPENKARELGVCEEFRSVLSSHIAKLDWMSETTKARAQKKLAAMKFDAGYPDEWLQEGLPQLKGNLTEDILLLRNALSSAKISLTGRNAKETMTNIFILSYPGIFLTANACYIPSINGLVINPALLLKPLYDENNSDAYNYAIFRTLGHEMTHGFDSKGSKYNEIGDVEDWWTVADKMEFEKRQKLLIDCYNHLELYDGREELRGLYTDGTNTLGENIADIGGISIAHEVYVNKLLKDGYSGEELEKQERKFYQAFADYFRLKRSIAYVKLGMKDVHPIEQERVNGVVMNIDRWYELYNVKWGDKLYLKPEKRTYIW